MRATAMRAHGGSPGDLVLLDRAVDLVREQAPGLVLSATGRRLHLWAGERPDLAEADVETLLLGLPQAGASESTAGLLVASIALLGLGRPEQAGRLAERAAAAAARRKDVVIGWVASVLGACAAGALGDPRSAPLLAELERSPVSRLSPGNTVMVDMARGWTLAGTDRPAARRWAGTVGTDVPIVGWHLGALSAAVEDPDWQPGHGLLGHVRASSG